jgi:hypothetical protein
VAGQSTGAPDPPDGLAERGHAFWCAITGQWELRADELELLREIVRTVDMVETLAAVVAREGPTVMVANSLKTHPSMVELRQQRHLLGRMLGQLALVDEDGSVLPSPLSARGRKAAQTRWGGPNRAQ